MYRKAICNHELSSVSSVVFGYGRLCHSRDNCLNIAYNLVKAVTAALYLSSDHFGIFTGCLPWSTHTLETVTNCAHAARHESSLDIRLSVPLPSAAKATTGSSWLLPRPSKNMIYRCIAAAVQACPRQTSVRQLITTVRA